MVKRLVSSASGALLLTATVASALAADAGTITRGSADQWRASKLAGVAIYGPDNRSVGKISDVLMSRDGKAQYVVIGVGGFLGLGEKDVAVPYDQVRFSDRPMTPPANPVPTGNNLAAPAAGTTMAGAPASGSPDAAAGGMADNGGIAPGATVGLGTQTDTPDTVPAVAGTANMAADAAYPDHGTIDMTADQLKAAPAFHFAR